MSLIARTVPAATNHVYNGNFEQGVAAWVGQTQTGVTFSGGQSYNWWYAGGDANDAGASYAMTFTATSGGGNPALPVSIFTTVAVSGGQSVAIAARSMVTDARLHPYLSLQFNDTASTTVSEPITVPTATVTQEHVLTTVAPAGTTSATLYCAVYVSVANIGGPIAYWDGIDCRLDAPLDTFLSGDEPGCTWTGTAGDSPSTRAAVTLNEVLGTGQGGVTTLTTRVYAADMLNNLGTELTGYFVAGSISWDVDRDVKCTCSLTFDDPSIRHAYDWVAVFAETAAEDGTIDAEQQGLFRFQQPKETLFGPSTTVVATGQDPVCLLANAIITDTYNVAASVNMQTAIVTVIESVGLTRHNIPASDATAIPGGWSWKPGTSKLSILNDLCAYVGWYSVYSTRDGRITTMPFVDAASSEPTRTYTLDQNASFVGPLVLTPNDASIRNVVLVTRDDPAQGTVMTGVARNDNPLSPISTVNIGEVGYVVPMTSVVDQATLDATARNYLQQASVLVSGQVDVLLDIAMDLHGVARIVVPDDQPDSLDAAGLWLISGWSTGLTASTAKTTLSVRRNEL